MKQLTEIFTFREGKMWIAAWRRFDVLAQGKTERVAIDRLIRSIAHQAIYDAIDGNLSSFGSAKPVPAKLLDEWQLAHVRTHGN